MFTLFATFLFSFQAVDGESIRLQALRRADKPRQEILKADDERSGRGPDSAIAVSRKWLTDPDFDPAMFQKDTMEYLAALLVRGDAQSVLARSLEATGQYERAFVAYADCRGKNPFPSSCGNGSAGDAVASEIGQGRCLERLGRHKEALGHYYVAARNCLARDQGATARIVALYEAAGQIRALRENLDRQDSDYINRTAIEGGKLPDPTFILENRPSARIRRMLDLLEAERSGHWDNLVTVASTDVRMGEDSLEACRRLARHSSIAIPLLQVELGKHGGYHGGAAYALVVCDPDAAARILKPIAEDASRPDWLATIGALDLAGDKGREALKDLVGRTPLHAQYIEPRLAAGKSNHLPGDPFPPIPTTLKLD